MRIRVGGFAAASLLALSISATGVAQDAKQLEQAKTHMTAGAAFYNDPSGRKCEEAYREFSKAYSLSGSLNALKGMGVCALELERDGDAIDHLTKFLAGKGAELPPEEKAQVEADIAALNSAVAWVTLTSDQEGVKITDVRTPTKGFPITNRYVAGPTSTRIGMHPGQHVITARNSAGESQEWAIEVANGAKYDHSFSFGAAAVPGPLVPPPGDNGNTPVEPDSGGDRPIPVTVYIFGGLTVALLVPTVIFMASASGANSDFDAANDGTRPEAELQGLRDDVTTTNLVADIFLGATIVSAAATAVFYFTRPTVATNTGFISVSPTMGTSGGGAVVIGTF